jgi:hypothetical protein
MYISPNARVSLPALLMSSGLSEPLSELLQMDLV